VAQLVAAEHLAEKEGERGARLVAALGREPVVMGQVREEPLDVFPAEALQGMIRVRA
jgi:hypothetical protein